ncbi:MAG: hypothetical protein PVJ57_05170 [Phycisphaerae bacterium]|jgi:hypothetical protein
MKPNGCESCRFRRYAEQRPTSWLARLWRWHTRWCPGWKAYQKTLAEKNEEQSAPKD